MNSILMTKKDNFSLKPKLVPYIDIFWCVNVYQITVFVQLMASASSRDVASVAPPQCFVATLTVSSTQATISLYLSFEAFTVHLLLSVVFVNLGSLDCPSVFRPLNIEIKAVCSWLRALL